MLFLLNGVTAGEFKPAQNETPLGLAPPPFQPPSLKKMYTSRFKLIHEISHLNAIFQRKPFSV